MSNPEQNSQTILQGCQVIPNFFLLYYCKEELGTTHMCQRCI